MICTNPIILICDPDHDPDHFLLYDHHPNLYYYILLYIILYYYYIYSDSSDSSDSDSDSVLTGSSFDVYYY